MHVIIIIIIITIIIIIIIIIIMIIITKSFIHSSQKINIQWIYIIGSKVKNTQS